MNTLVLLVMEAHLKMIGKLKYRIQFSFPLRKLYGAMISDCVLSHMASLIVFMFSFLFSSLLILFSSQVASLDLSVQDFSGWLSISILQASSCCYSCYAKYLVFRDKDLCPLSSFPYYQHHLWISRVL